MDSKCESVDHWRKFFQASQTNIFDIIKQALTVAATDYPEEFLSRRMEFAEKLHVIKHQCSSDESTNEKEEEEKISNKTGSDSSERKSVTSCSDSNFMGSIDTKKNSGKIKVSVVTEKEKLRATTTEKEKSKKRLREGSQLAKKLSPNFMGSSDIKNSGKTRVSVVTESEKLRRATMEENGKKRLREGYKLYANARRKIQLLDFKDLPKQEENRNKKTSTPNKK